MVFSSLAASCCRSAEKPLIPAVQISGTTSEKLAQIKRRAVPDECFRDKGLMSKWIDGNR
jgi:DNA mismatch repair protein MutH